MRMPAVIGLLWVGWGCATGETVTPDTDVVKSDTSPPLPDTSEGSTSDTNSTDSTPMADTDTDLQLSSCAQLRETLFTSDLSVRTPMPDEMRFFGMSPNVHGGRLRETVMAEADSRQPRDLFLISLSEVLLESEPSSLLSFPYGDGPPPDRLTYRGFVAQDDTRDVNGDSVPDIFFYEQHCARCAQDLVGHTTIYIMSGTERGHLDISDLRDRPFASFSSAGGDQILAAVGDVTGDGRLDLVRRDVNALVNATPTGRPMTVDVLSPPSMTGHHELGAPTISIHESTPGNQLGAVVLVRDLNGDGIEDLLLTDPYADKRGAVYLFFGPLSGHMTPAQADATFRGDGFFAKWGFFGRSIDVADADGDGTPDLLVGAPGFATAGGSSGSAFLFLGPFAGEYTHRDAALWIEAEHAIASNGLDVRFFGDVDGDGGSDFAVTAPLWEADPVLEISCDSADTGWRYLCRPWVNGRGAVTFWIGQRRGRVPVSDANYLLIDEYPAMQGGDAFAYRAHAPGDYTGDGLPDVLLDDNSDRYHRLLLFSPCAAEYMPAP